MFAYRHVIYRHVDTKEVEHNYHVNIIFDWKNYMFMKDYNSCKDIIYYHLQEFLDFKIVFMEFHNNRFNIFIRVLN